ncbi:Acyltransferase [Flavobacterium branchiophilum]|uniref:Acyltransferase n=2 Tax=Flavobacterium branchiophilum TaxID=55197 RepID=A0A2H3KBU1_9FLAO|nr:acyltransferase [Flavobacterium branchiophilum]PDS24643.1 acyltransferase [Flavobacterium branchiophilum]CCB68864.1 Probable acetyltransferase [Flavobacterium branchiophilum FL-15]
MKWIFKKIVIKILTYANRINNKQDRIELKQGFKKIGKNFFIGKDFIVFGTKYIEIGDDFIATDRFRLEALDQYGEGKFTPKVIIGNNVIFNTDVHIGCINRVEIGDNCLFASRIFIIDHHHGEPEAAILHIPPKDRLLVSKGPVIIENNVWVGEGVAIMPNVRIGKNSIIATNAVVTKDVPPNSVVAGVPAKVIKTMV